MARVIIYVQDNGLVAVVHPTLEALVSMSIEKIAAKDVPTGKRFKIIDAADIPHDRDDRLEWTIDESELTDGAGE